MALEYNLKILMTAYNSTLDQGDNSQSGKRWDFNDVDMVEDSLMLSKAWGTGKRMLESPETATVNKRFDQRGTRRATLSTARWWVSTHSSWTSTKLSS